MLPARLAISARAALSASASTPLRCLHSTPKVLTNTAFYPVDAPTPPPLLQRLRNDVWRHHPADDPSLMQGKLEKTPQELIDEVAPKVIDGHGVFTGACRPRAAAARNPSARLAQCPFPEFAQLRLTQPWPHQAATFLATRSNTSRWMDRSRECFERPPLFRRRRRRSSAAFCRRHPLCVPLCLVATAVSLQGRL